ncbi:hypothetical protein D3C73_1162540 [compost metagenome]
MIDPVDLVFRHHLEQAGVQRLRSGQIGTERFLDHHPPEGLRGFHQQTTGAQAAHHFAEETRRGGQVEDGVTGAAGGDFGRQRLIRAVVQEIALHVADTLGQLGPQLRVKGLITVADLAGHFGPNEILELLRKGLVGDGVVVNAHDPQSIPQQAVTTQVVQRRHQQALDQVTVGTEQEQRGRWCGFCLGFIANQSGHFFEVSTWPPKPKRCAERTLSPKVPCPRER